MTFAPPSPQPEGEAKGQVVFRVTPERVLALQLAMIATLVTLHVIGRLFHLLAGRDQLMGFGPLFDLDREGNIPTYYSTLIVLANAALLGLLGAAHRRQRLAGGAYWVFLCVVFLFLAYDEAFSVHEKLAEWVRTALRSDRANHLLWLVPGLGVVTAVAAISARFLFYLDRRTSLLMIASGAVFVGGAVGFELLGGLRYEAAQPTLAKPDAIYFACVTAEETLEMLGMALFNYALLDHLRAAFAELTFRLDR